MSTDLIKAQVSDNEAIAIAHVIADDETLRVAVTLLSNANKLADRAKEEKEKVTAPLNEALKAERARWKPLEDACANIVATLKSKILTYNAHQEAERAKKEAQLLARAEKGTMKVETVVNKLAALPDTSASVQTAMGAVQYRTVKKLSITDINLIPREYLVVDEVKVKEALKAGVVVPGAIIIEEKTIANLR
jgi:hypothetical protein